MNIANNRLSLVFALILGTGIAAAGYCIRGGMIQIKQLEQGVEVRGLAERIVDSDVASWHINYSASGDTMEELNAKARTTQKAILEFLRKNGVAEDEISRHPLQITDKLAQDYGNTKGNRFLARGELTVSSKQVAKLTDASQKTDDLVRAGVILTGSSLKYYFTELNAIKPAMLEEATRNARDAAARFAASAGAQVGRIRSASQGLFEIDPPLGGYDHSDSFKKKVRVVTQVKFALE